MQNFELRFNVLPEDIDRMGHVNNVVCLRRVQDLAVTRNPPEVSPVIRALFSTGEKGTR